MDVDKKPSGEKEKVLYLIHHLETSSSASIAEFIKNKTGKVPGVLRREDPGVYIWFPSKEDNQMAQSKLDGLKVEGGETVKCVWTDRVSRIPERKCWNTSECIYITGMNANTTTQQIARFIKQKGGIEIKNNAICILPADSKQQKSAVIRCGSKKSALELVKKLNLKEMNGKKVWIQIRVDLKGKTKSLQIVNMKDDVTEQDVANLLQKSKKIKNAPKKIRLIPLLKPGRSGKITFKTIEEAERAYDVLSNSKLKGREISVMRYKQLKMKKTQIKKEMKTLRNARKKARARGEKIDLGEQLVTIMTVPVSGKALKEIKKTKDVKMKKKSNENKGKQKLNGKKKKTKGATNAKAAKGKKAKGKKETGKKAKGKKTKGKSVKV